MGCVSISGLGSEKLPVRKVGFGDFSVKTLPEVLYVCFTMLIGQRFLGAYIKSRDLEEGPL